MSFFLRIFFLAFIHFLSLPAQTQAQVLPPAWEGTWGGTVYIWSYNVNTDSFPMSLEITPLDSGWNFVINYQRDKNQPDLREYELRSVDPSTYHFAIDEKNSIILDAYLNDNCLYTVFSGMGSELQSRMCLSDGGLEYEITSVLSEPTRISGDQVMGSDTIPEIMSYDLYHVMKARLKKGE
ncbi:MAG: hypothetical protein AAF804_04170 [Bacteroidota bacterium]